MLRQDARVRNVTEITGYRRGKRDRGRGPWRTIGRTRGPMARRAKSALANVRVVGLGGFFAALLYFQAGLPVPWGGKNAAPQSPYTDERANDWQAPAGLPRPTAPTPAEPYADARGDAGGDALSARFHLCHSGGGTNCVVDGDTFWFQGQKIRIADIDTPETHPARCAEEARLGEAATQRLHSLLNAGPFTLEGDGHDRYGRALRTVTRDGDSLGGVLVGEGLARWYGGGRQPWC